MIDIHEIIALHSSLAQDYVVAHDYDERLIKKILDDSVTFSLSANGQIRFIEAAYICQAIYTYRPFASWNDLVAIRVAIRLMEKAGLEFNSFALTANFFEQFEAKDNYENIYSMANFFELNTTKIK